VIILILATTPFLYKNQNQEEAIKLLNAYNQIKLSLSAVARLVSKNKYKDYNSQESYDPGKKKALV
jgi:argininosuccinate lyase